MIELKNFLGCFDKFLQDGAGRKELIREIIKNETGISINSKDIIIKNDIISLNIKPIYKNELFLKKGQIFLKLKESLGKKCPKNFR
jgi:hypothetical protein